MDPSPPVLPGLKWEKDSGGVLWGTACSSVTPSFCLRAAVLLNATVCFSPITVTLKTALLWLSESAGLLRVAKQVRPRPSLD